MSAVPDQEAILKSSCDAPPSSPLPTQERGEAGSIGDVTGPREQPFVLQRAGQLVTALAGVHGISADAHELRSGRAVVSVYHGLLAYTDGARFWWTGPELSSSGALVLSSAVEPSTAAERLAAHYEILRARPVTTLLGGRLPLLADVMLAEHVVPR